MSNFPAILLQAQYLNILDYFVRNDEVRSSTKCPSVRRTHQLRLDQSLVEAFTTLIDFAEDPSVPSQLHRQQAQARTLAETIHWRLGQPYDPITYRWLVNDIAGFLTAPYYGRLVA